jgi:hypothetical protein
MFSLHQNDEILKFSHASIIFLLKNNKYKLKFISYIVHGHNKSKKIGVAI